MPLLKKVFRLSLRTYILNVTALTLQNMLTENEANAAKLLGELEEFRRSCPIADLSSEDTTFLRYLEARANLILNRVEDAANALSVCYTPKPFYR